GQSSRKRLGFRVHKDFGPSMGRHVGSSWYIPFPYQAPTLQLACQLLGLEVGAKRSLDLAHQPCAAPIWRADEVNGANVRDLDRQIQDSPVKLDPSETRLIVPS